MTFEKFQNRVVIKAQLVAQTPIFIGARADSFKPDAVNGSCVKDVYGVPYIPGSSLKGVLRAFLSNVLAEPIKSIVNEDFEGKQKREAYGTPKELADAIYAASTRVERLFGSQVMSGKVKIADAMPIENQIATEVRNGVAIDRDTHTALSGALFDTEVVPSGTAFNFMASAENLTSAEADDFGNLMEYFAEGNITVGGRSRAGLGSVEIRDAVVTIHRAVPDDFPAKEAIKCSSSKQIKEAICKCSQN